jgi:hypothetical protein
MLRLALITRPARAVAIVAAVGLVFGIQGAIALRWPQPENGWGDAQYASQVLLAAALVAAIVGLSVLAPLHSRVGTAGLWIARAGLALPLLATLASLGAGHDVAAWPVWAGVLVALPGAGAVAFARWGEADLPARLLEVALGATIVAPLLAERGGCLLAGIAWVTVAASLWGAYLAPATGVRRSAAPAA